ncbi:hypothetical protein HBH26_12300 [Sphingomonas sp. 36D10-4-7]|uniref:Uncharacterized protein n=1 Tax=Sphingomonas corticis TaxID=2722791 RepID=A0ABX1CN39_9SPHN|nr:hypothetical protein [Sphingomonas corticis]NJR79363.1 hypothetical protein [Sphingomonas corticis]
MGGAKPLASLSSTLLARKGQARPAMRRQATLASLSQAGDDLGWNDMGEPLPLPVLPPVLEERAQLEEAIAPEPVAAPAPAPVPAAVVAAVAASVPHGRKAAFTLRLDSERHLRLRLASAARGRSAQQLVTDALDALIATMPEVEALRGQLPTGA